MKKTAIVQKDLKALRSGVARKVISEVGLFRSMGWQVEVISEKANRKLIEANGAQLHKTFRWPIKGFYRRKHFDRAAARVIKKSRPDLVIGHGNIIEQDICYIHNCVHLAHEKIFGEPLPASDDVGRMHEMILKAKKFDVLVCNSELMKADLTQRFGLQDKRLEVIYPCFDENHFAEPRSGVREQFGISPSAVVVGLITSGDFRKRNVDFFLKSLGQLPTDKEMHIVVAGGSSTEPYELIAQQSKHPVSFLPSSDSVADYYGLIDIFALPAHIEEYGRSVAEAMYFEKPVIVHNQVGASEILEGASRDFILDKLDSREFQEKVRALLDNQVLRKEIGAMNRKAALQYTTAKQNQKLLQLLESLNLAVAV